jgi:hypothetical protein
MQLRPLREIDFISAQNGLVLNVNFCENHDEEGCPVCAGYLLVNTSRTRVSFIVLVFGGDENEKMCRCINVVYFFVDFWHYG